MEFQPTDATTPISTRAAKKESGLSYKFQRLRERLREAIAKGDLAGKLPGERALARRFHVNAKTLSKALTDLAAEGVLDRSIGRGTYVKGSAPTVAAAAKPWLIICDEGHAEPALVGALMAQNPGSQVSTNTDASAMRPSFLNQFGAVIDLAANTPDALLRDLIVRNVPVVSVGGSHRNIETRTFSTHTVDVDLPLAVTSVGRELLLSGHTRVAAVEPRHSSVVREYLGKAAARYNPRATVEGCFVSEVVMMVENGATAIVCDSAASAFRARQLLEQAGVSVPGRVSLAAVGTLSGEASCSGYFVPCEQKVQAVVQLLNDSAAATRPTTLWLAARRVDMATIAETNVAAEEPGIEAGLGSMRVSGMAV